MARYFLVTVPDDEADYYLSDAREVVEIFNGTVTEVQPHHAPGVPVDVYYAGELG